MKHDVELWKDIVGYEGFYQISNFGRVKSLKGWNGREYIEREKILKCSNQKSDNKSSYERYKVTLKKYKERKDFKVHRLVAEAFIPNPNNYKIVNHKDCNPLNNKVDNLEWCDSKHNFDYAVEMDNISYQIDKIDRESLLEMLNNGFSYDEIASMIGVAKGTVFNYIKRFKIKKVYI